MSAADRPITLTLTLAEAVLIMGELTTLAVLGREHDGNASLRDRLKDAIVADTKAYYAERLGVAE